jgi:hypothetical protein
VPYECYKAVRKLAADPKWLAKNALHMQKLWADPEYREKHIARTRKLVPRPRRCPSRREADAGCPLTGSIRAVRATLP